MSELSILLLELTLILGREQKSHVAQCKTASNSHCQTFCVVLLTKERVINIKITIAPFVIASNWKKIKCSINSMCKSWFIYITDSCTEVRRK